MTVAITVTGAREMQERLARASLTYRQRTESLLRLMSFRMRERLVQRMNVGAPRHPFWGKGSPRGAFLGARSGLTRLRLSPGGIVTRAGNVIATAVGSPDRHVRLHELGGTVRGGSPRGYLRIPTAAAQKLSGEDRYAGRSIRDIPGAFLIRLRTGSLWAVRVTRGAGAAREGPSRGSRLEFLYLLKRSATYRPRGIFAAVAREMQAEFVRLGATEMRAVVSTAGGA